MARNVSRRRFLRAGAAVAATTVAATAANTSLAQGDQEPRKLKIIAVACSPRRQDYGPSAAGLPGSGKSGGPRTHRGGADRVGGPQDPGPRCRRSAAGAWRERRLSRGGGETRCRQRGWDHHRQPGIFLQHERLCKAFLDRCFSFRARKFALANKVAAVVAVGGVRNGGQELTIQSIQAALMCQEMLVVGDGRPTAHTGATLWNSGKDDISDDEFGLGTAKNLGRRVAEVALNRAT